MPLAFIACYAALHAYRQVRKALKLARKEANDMIGEQSKPEVDGGEAAQVDKNQAGQPEGSAVATEGSVTQRANARTVATEGSVTQRANARARLEAEWSVEFSRSVDEKRPGPWLMQSDGTVPRACYRALRDREASLSHFPTATPHCSIVPHT